MENDTVPTEKPESFVATEDLVQEEATPTCGQKFRAYLERENEKILIDRSYFTGFIYGAICVNAIQMGMQVDHKDGAWATLWLITETIFMFIFVGEALIKMVYLRVRYFYAAESFDEKGNYVRCDLDNWNCLDCTICFTAIVSWCFAISRAGEESSSEGGFGSILKVFQFLRLLRMVKLLRMKRELVSLVEGIVGSLKSMIWIALLLFVIIYTFAIFFTKVVKNHDYPSDVLDKDVHFGRLNRTMLTLFNIAILDTWGSIIRPFSVEQPYLVLFMLLFLVLTAFSIMNAIVGIVVEKTTSAANAMAASDAEAAKLEQHRRAEELLDLINEIDADDDGLIDFEELTHWAVNTEVGETKGRELLESIELPNHFTMGDLHRMLDVDGDGLVTNEEFHSGLARLIDVNPFHSLCATQLSMGHIKKRLYKTNEDMKKTRKEVDEVLLELKALREHLKLPEPPAQEQKPSRKTRSSLFITPGPKRGSPASRTSDCWIPQSKNDDKRTSVAPEPQMFGAKANEMDQDAGDAGEAVAVKAGTNEVRDHPAMSKKTKKKRGVMKTSITSERSSGELPEDGGRGG